MIRPRRTFFRSITYASFSRSMPSLSWMNPPESLRVTGLAPRSSSFSTVYCATLPEPETRQVLSWRLSSRVFNISWAK